MAVVRSGRRKRLVRVRPMGCVLSNWDNISSYYTTTYQILVELAEVWLQSSKVRGNWKAIES